MFQICNLSSFSLFHLWFPPTSPYPDRSRFTLARFGRFQLLLAEFCLKLSLYHTFFICTFILRSFLWTITYKIYVFCACGALRMYNSFSSTFNPRNTYSYPILVRCINRRNRLYINLDLHVTLVLFIIQLVRSHEFFNHSWERTNIRWNNRGKYILVVLLGFKQLNVKLNPRKWLSLRNKISTGQWYILINVKNVLSYCKVSVERLNCSPKIGACTDFNDIV